MLASEERLYLSIQEADEIVKHGGVNLEHMKKRDEIRLRWVNGGNSLMVECKSVEQRRKFQRQVKAILTQEK